MMNNPMASRQALETYALKNGLLFLGFVTPEYPNVIPELRVDLLDDSTYTELLARPRLFVERIPKSFDSGSWVVVDEIQRLPGLLNYVHQYIEERKIRFALTGSSARKLKRGGANLLAGRAFVNVLHALSMRELPDDFVLDFALNWGLLPKIHQLPDPTSMAQFLRSYTSMYLREEIKEEQIVRQLDSFARFLEVAAQQNTQIINFSKIAREAQTEDKTVQRYFSILEDTFLGFMLPAFHRSVRRAQRMRPKFYFFDPGVKRAIEGSLTSPLVTSTYAYGQAFEHFFILECVKLRDALRPDDKIYFIRTKDGVEIDLLVERPGRELWAVEIKSSERVDSTEIESKRALAKDLRVKRFIVASREARPRNVSGVEYLPWADALEALFPR
jgi:predicted AAA+ superfamily ATPase